LPPSIEKPNLHALDSKLRSEADGTARYLGDSTRTISRPLCFSAETVIPPAKTSFRRSRWPWGPPAT